MWGRSDCEDGFEIYKPGSVAPSPGWVPVCESAWQGAVSTSAGGGSNRARRHSTASDSGDTGIGTSCSDSVEDQSSSSGTLTFLPLRSQGSVPTAHVMPSPSGSQPPTPLHGPLDMKDPRPVRRWSSLTRLGGPDKGRPGHGAESMGSLDRGLLHLGTGLQSRGGRAERGALDLTFSALPERKPTLAHQAVGGSPIQPAVRTQMWLSEQMHSNPVEYRAGPEACGTSPWQAEQQRERVRREAELTQMLSGNALPVNTLVKIKEGLLRQRELEIDRQKQQILHLHARIKENELRAQQVLQSQNQNQKGHCEDPYPLKTKDGLYDGTALEERLLGPGPLCCDGGELGRKLAAAQMEVLHLNEFLKRNTQKYTEDIKKLEEKMKTRDRYIGSLKKKCQRESEQNQEKQQRVETLEKYLADLPSLDEVQNQAQRLEEVQLKSRALQNRITQLERELAESRALSKEKEVLIESQTRREKELVASVQSLQEKVEKCLEDGVRLPVIDLKQLETDNVCLKEQRARSGELIDGQKKEMEKLCAQLTAAEKRLREEEAASQELRRRLLEKDGELERLSQSLREKQRGAEEVSGPDVDPLLKEMSLCLLDLQALCSILTQRAQGKEPNLALLLGIKSMSCSGEENERAPPEDSPTAQLTRVRQLRKDIDELRAVISDRYAQDMGDNCMTQ